MSFDKCLMTLCLPFQYPPPPPSLATTDLFIVCVVLPFPECHLVGILWYEVFSNWLLSLSSMHLSLLHVFLWLNSLFLFYPRIILSCTHALQFIHSSWWLPSFGTMKKLLLTFMYRFFCGQKISSHLGKCLGAQLLD